MGSSLRYFLDEIVETIDLRIGRLNSISELSAPGRPNLLSFRPTCMRQHVWNLHST